MSQIDAEPVVLRGKANGMKVSRYDQVAGMLIASLIMVGFAVGLMFMIWLTTVLVFRNVYIPPELLDYGGGVDTPEGYEEDLEEPGLEELPDVTEPALEATLEAVTDLVSTQMASLNSIDSSATAAGHGSGMGDARKKGPGGEGNPDIIPPWERWEIRYQTSGVTAYAKQLDFFKIELAAIGGSKNVDYLKNMSKGNGEKRQEQGSPEKILWFMNREAKLASFDRQLLAKAGIKVTNRLVIQVYPRELELMMLGKEVEAARKEGHTDPREFLRTVFEVKGSGASFQFEIIDQEFRDAPG